MSPRPPKKEFVALYLCYRSLIESLKTLPNSRQISAELEPLLIAIAQAWHEGAPFPVRKLLIKEGLGSPATIHKRIHQLQQAGFVSLETLASDARVRLVVPSNRAMGDLAKKGEAVQQANRQLNLV
ncbi:MAG: hypothetical protein EBV34_15855 [Betaproteobacteria bacterium]|nr:hypothetical protein [Betaproteobacteria bacterium]